MHRNISTTPSFSHTPHYLHYQWHVPSTGYCMQTVPILYVIRAGGASACCRNNEMERVSNSIFGGIHFCLGRANELVNICTLWICYLIALVTYIWPNYSGNYIRMLTCNMYTLHGSSLVCACFLFLRWWQYINQGSSHKYSSIDSGKGE